MLDQVFVAITSLGNLVLAVILGAIILVPSFKKKAFPSREIIALIIAFIIRTAIVEGFRMFYPVPRPFVAENFEPLIAHEANGSFPSGHASTSFLLTSFIYSKDKKVGMTVGLLAILVAISRVYVGVHYPIDVLAGGFVGIGSFLAGSFLASLLTNKHKMF